MSWQNSLQVASFRGETFDVMESSDDLNFAYAVHAYPYRAGANIEDTGRDPRQVSLTAVFWTEDYETALNRLLKALDQPGSGELIHPVFGVMKVKVVSVGIPFVADQPNYCELPIQFIEDALDTPVFAVETVAGSAESINESINDAETAAMDPFEARIAGMRDDGVVSGRNNALQAMEDAVHAMQEHARQLGAPAFEMLGTLTAAVSYITSPVSFIQDMKSGFLARLAALAGRVELARAMPAALQKAIFGSGKSASIKSRAPAWAETRDHLQLTIIEKQYEDQDTVLRDRSPVVMAMARYCQALALARAANDFLASDAAAALTPNEIADVAADARAALESVITEWRSLFPELNDSRPVAEALKKIAVDLQAQAEAVVNRRPSLVARATHAPGNLRLIAFWWYNDATRADELLRLNPQIKEPNFIPPKTRLVAYAE